MRLFSGSDDYEKDDELESLSDLMVRRDREFSPVEHESFSEKMLASYNEMTSTVKEKKMKK